MFSSFLAILFPVDHELLLKKLELYRVGDVALSWFGSYLSERSQFVALDGSLSKRLEVKQGVPQGSVLGPVLFLLFVNDLPLYLHNSSADIFADDTTLSLKAHFDDIVNLTNNLHSDLVNFSEWSKENRMFINVEKTKIMLVTTSKAFLKSTKTNAVTSSLSRLKRI